jgi:hypothetical protein
VGILFIGIGILVFFVSFIYSVNSGAIKGFVSGFIIAIIIVAMLISQSGGYIFYLFPFVLISTILPIGVGVWLGSKWYREKTGSE